MLLDDIGSLLATAGVGVLGTDLFTGVMPDSPDGLVAIYEHLGAPNLPVLRGVLAERPRVQVIARGEPDDYVGARTKAFAAYDAMRGTQGTLGSTSYLSLEPVGPPAPLEVDGRGRYHFVFNCDVMKEV